MQRLRRLAAASGSSGATGRRCLQASVAAAQLDDAPTEQPKAWKGMKRFYDQVEVEAVNARGDSVDQNDPTVAGYQVVVAGRALRTNQLNELRVPTQGLALAIAYEFATQGEKIIPATTPLYNMAAHAIDSFMAEEVEVAERMDLVRPRLDAYLRETAESVLEKQGEAAVAAASQEPASKFDWPLTAAAKAVAAQGADAPEGAISEVLGTVYGVAAPGASGALTAVHGGSDTERLREMLKDYLETDTACFRVGRTGSVGDLMLRRRQDRHYDPLLNWFERSFGIRLGVVEGLLAPTHPAEAAEVVEDLVDRADPYLRAAMYALVGATKSTVVTLALVFRAISAEQALWAARVEEEHQIEEHGFVEDGHDTSRAHTKLVVGTAASMMWLVPESSPTTQGGTFAAIEAASLVGGDMDLPEGPEKYTYDEQGRPVLLNEDGSQVPEGVNDLDEVQEAPEADGKPGRRRRRRALSSKAADDMAAVLKGTAAASAAMSVAAAQNQQAAALAAQQHEEEAVAADEEQEAKQAQQEVDPNGAVLFSETEQPKLREAFLAMRARTRARRARERIWKQLQEEADIRRGRSQQSYEPDLNALNDEDWETVALQMRAAQMTGKTPELYAELKERGVPNKFDREVPDA